MKKNNIFLIKLTRVVYWLVCEHTCFLKFGADWKWYNNTDSQLFSEGIGQL